MSWRFWLVVLMFAGCGSDRPTPDETQAATTSVVGAPAVSDPLRQGFTQRPAPDTPGLPPPIPPLLSLEERADAMKRRERLTSTELDEAQRELAAIVATFEADPADDLVVKLRQTATALALRGRIDHLTIADLYGAYLFPNPESETDAKYKGRLVLLTGTVAPANMKDFADGFKLIEQNPYVHDPLLLATDYELSFVECRLAHPAHRALRDWEPIHFVAEVEGKRTSDVLLKRCIVL